MERYRTPEMKLFGDFYSPEKKHSEKYKIFEEVYNRLLNTYNKFKDAPQILKEVELSEVYKTAHIHYIFPFEDETFVGVQDYFRDRFTAIMTMCSQSCGFIDDETNDTVIGDNAIREADNPYPQVFANYNAFLLFQKFHVNEIGNTKPLANYSFIYRMMFKDNLINRQVTPTAYIEWLSKEPYSVYLDKLKTLRDCSTKSKITAYNLSKEILRINT